MKHEIEIPDEYEISSTFSSTGTVDKPRIEIYLRKKQTKDFNYFVDQYLPSRDNSTSDEIIDWMDRDAVDRLNTYLKTKQFNLVPWEVKVGLFRFICENLELNTINCLSYCFEYTIHSNVSKIISQEFIDSLKQNKN